MDRFGCDYFSELGWEAESCQNCAFIIQMAGCERWEEGTPRTSCQRVPSPQGQQGEPLGPRVQTWGPVPTELLAVRRVEQATDGKEDLQMYPFILKIMQNYQAF